MEKNGIYPIRKFQNNSLFFLTFLETEGPWMRKWCLIIIFILCICFSFVGCNSNNFNIENQSDIIWRCEDPDVYFSFSKNSEYGSEGYLNINDETIPIIVIAGRKNFLYFKDARGYSENTEENYNLFYGIYKYDKSSLILKIKKDYIFDYTYDKIVFNKCEE